jgi:hypothetical protein
MKHHKHNILLVSMLYLFNKIYDYLYVFFNVILFIFYTYALNFIYDINKNNILMFGFHVFIIFIVHNLISIKIIILLLMIVMSIVLYLEQKFEFYLITEYLNYLGLKIKNLFSSNKYLEKYKSITEFDSEKIIPYIDYFFSVLKPIHLHIENKIYNFILNKYMKSITKNTFDKINESNNIENTNNILNEIDNNTLEDVEKIIQNLTKHNNMESIDDFMNSDSEYDSESDSEFNSKIKIN